MSNRETTDNFLAVWDSFEWPEIKEPEYRCYYQEDGTVDFYTMEALAGNYILVDRETYVTAPCPARVVDGKLQVIKPRTTIHKLKPSETSGTLCHCNDVTVVVEANGIHWKQQQNEIN